MIPNNTFLCDIMYVEHKQSFLQDKMRNSRERPPKGGCFRAWNPKKHMAIKSNHWYNHIEYFFYN